MTASEKRVKLSHWAGEAWEACCKDRNAMRRYMEKAGAMMTADGTGDELIALEGMPKDYQYEFMHVEIDTADPDEDDLEGEEEDPEEIPDPDVEETPLADRFSEVTEDTGEMELCTDDPEAPDGYEFVEECPAVGNKKEMINRIIMFRWDCGWAQGTIRRRHTKGTTYNYFVQYMNDDGSSDQYRQGLKASNYYNAEDSPDGAWVVVRKTAE